MKTYGGGCIIVVQVFHNWGHSWKWMASFKNPPIYFPEKEPPLPVVIEISVDSRADMDAEDDRKIPCPCRESSHDFSIIQLIA